MIENNAIWPQNSHLVSLQKLSDATATEISSVLLTQLLSRCCPVFVSVLLVYFCQNPQLQAKKKVSVKKWQISPKFLHKKAPRYVNSRWLLTNLVILMQQQLLKKVCSMEPKVFSRRFFEEIHSKISTISRIGPQISIKIKIIMKNQLQIS